MIKNKKILITGGGGFIGVNLAKRLVKDNQLILLDMNFDNNSLAFSDLKNNKNIKLVKADILDISEIAKIVPDVQIVVHMAAMVGVQEVLNNSLYTLDVNYIGTSNLLKAISQNSNPERVIFFSTSEIYGSNALRISEEGDTLLSTAQNARWCYCISKLAAEHLAFSYFRQKGMPVVIVRPFNVFGPLRVGDHVVLRFIMKALKNEDMEVYGDGTQIRAWCYIDDFCNALLKAMEVEGAKGQAFNIGNPLNTLTIYALAKKIISLCNSKSKIVFKEPGFKDIDLRIPDISKSGEILKFTPKIEIEEGLTKTIEWVKENFDKLSLRAQERKYVV